MFRLRGKSVNISEKDPLYKVKYLGNVLTAFMKGEGCVDRPTSVLWNNYLSSPDCVSDMQLMVCASGLKVVTKQNGPTEYRAHRISYCVCHPQYPRLFVWVYRHEGKKMKVELRCHAVLCKNEAVAKAIAVQLHDKLSFALAEFTREKTRRQRARLAMQRANSAPSTAAGLTTTGALSSAPPMRTRFLSVGQNFKPPSDQSTAAPKLGSISEDQEEETTAADGRRVAGGNGHATSASVRKEARNGKLPGIEEDVDLDNCTFSPNFNEEDFPANFGCAKSDVRGNARGSHSSSGSEREADETVDDGAHKFIVGELSDGDLDLEIGNDILQLKNDAQVRLELINRQQGLDSDSDCSGDG